jgi:hypothetical protein
MDPINEQEGIAPDKGRIETLTELCIRRGNGALELELTLPVVPRCAVLAALGSVLRRMAQAANPFEAELASTGRIIDGLNEPAPRDRRRSMLRSGA